MRNRSLIIALAAVISLLCLFYLSFTFVKNGIMQDAETYATAKDGSLDKAKKQRYLDSLWQQDVYLGFTLKEVMEQSINLGLDLQGGMHVVLEVSPAEIVRSLGGKGRDAQLNEAIRLASVDQLTSKTNFVDLFYKNYQKVAPNKPLASIFSNASNRGKINANTSDGEVVAMLKTEVEGAIDRSFQIIRTRVDKFGVTNPNIQRIPGTGRIQVELPGVDNPERARKLLSAAARLEFCEVVELGEYANAMTQVGEYLLANEKNTQALGATLKADTKGTDSTKAGLEAQLAGKTTAKNDTTKKDTTAANTAGGALGKYFIQLQSGLGSTVKDTGRVNALLARPEVKALFPPNFYFLWDVKPVTKTSNTNEDVLGLTVVRRDPQGNAPLEGDVITDAAQDFDQSGRVEVTMAMNAEGARKWRNLTAANVGKRVAIVLDEYVYSAPVVQNEIPNGRSSISGTFTVEEGQDLANVLKAGKLPAKITIAEEAVVGATLGSESVSKGLMSSLVGLVVVLLFMIAYYNRAGIIADIALVVNLFLLMGIMAYLKAVLTLPGIAGIVLTIGMAVDANVLIYERIKEELASGKSFVQAIADGFKNAYSSIIDSNVTTFLTGIILFTFGTGVILGFATTLVWGILTSLFSAIFISRLILDYYASRGKTINFFASWSKNLFKDSQFDFVSRRRLYYIISSVIIGAGIVSILVKGFGLGVDFKGGRSYVARFEKSVNTDDVRNVLNTALNSSPEVKTFGGDNQVKITTSYMIENSNVETDKIVETKVQEALAKIAGNKGRIESSQKVGPTVAYDTMISAVWAVLLAIAVVFGYILIRFKRLAFGYGAVVALFHDVLIILAIFSIGNGLLPFSLDVDQAFVGAVLTIMGYSMNDTIVVFDRVREYLADSNRKQESIPTIINNALNSTLSRTAVTGLSTLLVLIVLFSFGGEVIRGFSFAMLIGVIVGTYSSLFVATPIVVDALTREQNKKGSLTPEVAAADKPAAKGKKAAKA